MSDWRIARKTTASVAGGDSLDVDMDADSNGGSTPIACLIRNIVVAPATSTVFAFRIFSKASRIIDPSDEDYSLVREYTWTAGEEASTDPLQISNPIPYFDEDAEGGTNYAGKFWCQLEIKALIAASVFHVMLTFDD